MLMKLSKRLNFMSIRLLCSENRIEQTICYALLCRGRIFLVINTWHEASIQDLIQQLAQTAKESFGNFEDAIATKCEGPFQIFDVKNVE